MKGHKSRLFILDLSFIGWVLVGFLTLGIGFLWITPYTTATRTAFYNDLVGSPSIEDSECDNEEWDESLI